MIHPETKLTVSQERALQLIDYLHVVIVSAAADSEHLPYLQERPDTDRRIFGYHLASLSCVMQVHLQDLAISVVHEGQVGRIGNFANLIADTIFRIRNGDNVQKAIHQHIRNLFALETAVHSDVPNEDGRFVVKSLSPYALAIEWMLDMLLRMERLDTMAEILGGAQNTEICTRLCFANAMNTLQQRQRDLRLIIRGTTSVM